MSIERRTRAEIDEANLLANLAAQPRPGEDEIEAQTAEDGDAWTDAGLAEAEPVYPPPSPERLRALRARLGLTQALFARHRATIRARAAPSVRAGSDAASRHRS